MAPERITVEIFYDVVSPYTWVAFEVLCRYRPYWNMNLKLRPFFLGGIMKESGNKPPMMVPNKGVYMNKDLARIASYYGVPLKFIENPLLILVEKGSIRAMRFLTAINLNYPEYLESVSRELWNRIWSNGEDIVESESLQEAANKAKMPESIISNCIQLMDSLEIKDSLKKTTGEAIEFGAFGAPTIVVHAKSGPEMFFGSDRFPLIAAMMNEPWLGPFPDKKSSL